MMSFNLSCVESLQYSIIFILASYTGLLTGDLGIAEGSAASIPSILSFPPPSSLDSPPPPPRSLFPPWFLTFGIFQIDDSTALSRVKLIR